MWEKYLCWPRCGRCYVFRRVFLMLWLQEGVYHMEAKGTKWGSRWTGINLIVPRPWEASSQVHIRTLGSASQTDSSPGTSSISLFSPWELVQSVSFVPGQSEKQLTLRTSVAVLYKGRSGQLDDQFLPSKRFLTNPERFWALLLPSKVTFPYTTSKSSKLTHPVSL